MAPNLLYAAEFNHAKRIIRYNSPTIVRFDGDLPPAFMAAILRGLRSPDSLNEGQDGLWEEEPVVPEAEEVSNVHSKDAEQHMVDSKRNGPNKESGEVVANAAIRTGETEQLERTVGQGNGLLSDWTTIESAESEAWESTDLARSLHSRGLDKERGQDGQEECAGEAKLRRMMTYTYARGARSGKEREYNQWCPQKRALGFRVD
ncbi:hypothetical protein B0H11DRAFT_1936495 [Mycena galericulata]|nr:hypothetical protein B0H11DRAFT_1936495 [Mycena galericulata]